MKVTEEMIRNKAYELWEANGKPMGQEEENWFLAQDLLHDAVRSILSVRNQLPPNGLRQLATS